MSMRTVLVAALLTWSVLGPRAQAGSRRALLIGINDYSASQLQTMRGAVAPTRSVPNLDGTANDVELMRELLIALYGFTPADIVSLQDQRATREAILGALDRQLLAPAKQDDVVFFYFSGHGSQVPNSLSREADRLDESLVPADARLGAPDIRDKELLRIFNGILDRGAQLTIVLDTCHSGSGARGLDGGLRARGVARDSRDARDPTTGPLPEDRGALILSAAQDFDDAFETLDERGNVRGAFTWALARAMRDADAGEPASETFLRARATLHAERPAQDPVIAGSRVTQRKPLLGIRGGRRDRHPVIAVERVLGADKVLLQGGWASGITVGSELRLAGDDEARVEVTSLLGVAHAEARVMRGATRLRPGTLLEIATWAAPPSQPLRVWIPAAPRNVIDRARAFHEAASQRGIRWINDPTHITPTHLLRWKDGGWELITDGRHSRPAAPLDAVPAGASLYVQLPASESLRNLVANVSGIEWTHGPDTADYVLAGRHAAKRVEYAWVHPFATERDRTRSVLPVRSAWKSAADALREYLVHLRTVQAWQDLRSPASSRYRIALRRVRDGALVQDGALAGDERYQLVLRERDGAHGEPLYARYLYAFVIDSSGRSILLFPRPEMGAVENLLPVTSRPAEPLRDVPVEIPLTGAREFSVDAPYGLDTYFLLSSDEPLPSLTDLEWDGVRAPRTRGLLDELLARTLAGTRSPGETLRTPPNWSIDKVVFESIPPRRKAR